jgi:hypothetical protein
MRKKEETMARSRTKAKVQPALTLAGVRASIGRVQSRGEHLVTRLRRDAESLMKRSRVEVAKEVRDLERRVLKSFHAATEQQVGRLEHRIARLEQAMAELRRSGGTGGERAA